MQKFILINYQYQDIKGQVMVDENMSEKEIKNICVLDSLDKREITKDLKILKGEKFKYERI